MKPVKSEGKGEKRSTREKRPASKPAAAPAKPVKVETRSPVEKQHLANIGDFAELVKELLDLNGAAVISSKGKRVNALVASAQLYIKVLNSANCKLEKHHHEYREMYAEYKPEILKCFVNDTWMNELDENTVIDIQLGKGTEFERKNVTLKVSAACYNAIKVREAIKNARYKNANEKQIAFASTDFQYVALFHFRLLTVIRDALGDEHADSKRLADLIEKFRIPAGMGDDEDEEEKPQGEGIARFINGISGDQAKKIDSKGVVDAIEKVTSNTGMIDNITTAIKDLNNPSNKKNRADQFADLAKQMAPTFETMFTAVTGQQMGGDDDEETESGSESSGSEESE